MVVGDFPIKDKIVVVTGGGSGINLSFTKLAAAAGARVVIIADLKLTSAAEEYVKSVKNVVFEKCDVAKWADLQNLVTVSEKNYGDVPDVYIAGAGVFEPAWSNFWDDKEEERYAQVDINVNHPIKLSRIAIRALLSKNKKGVVLITASIAGISGTYSAALYCATKHAMVGFVRSMEPSDRLEGVKIVAVAPGLVATPLWTDRPDIMDSFGYKEEASNSPDEVAECMLDMVQGKEYPGGTVIEITKPGRRVIGTWNIPPPAHSGSSVPDEIIDKNYASIKKTLAAERKV